MASNSDFFIKKTLGDDFFESLQKFELWKPGTRTTIDHEEIKTALLIVPRTLMALLIRELTSMNIGEAKEVLIPNKVSGAILKVTKQERDVYTGHLEEENKVIVDFKYRSIPGIGLVVMSALELYDVEALKEKEIDHSPDVGMKLQQMIEERLALHDLVNKVVDRKLAEKDAIQQLLLARITEKMSQPALHVPIEAMKGPEAVMSKSDAKQKKTSPLGTFLDQRKNKTIKKNEFSIQLAKGEHVNCPDCGGNIFDGQVFAGCICVGDDMEKKVFLRKTEDGIKVRFSKGWDQENIEMLLEMLRRKNG